MRAKQNGIWEKMRKDLVEKRRINNGYNANSVESIHKVPKQRTKLRIDGVMGGGKSRDVSVIVSRTPRGIFCT